MLGFLPLSAGALDAFESVIVVPLPPPNAAVRGALATAVGRRLTGLSGLRWAYWDTTDLAALGAPVSQGANLSTDGSGNFVLPIYTKQNVGDEGLLAISNANGLDNQSPPARGFIRPVKIQSL